MATRPDSDLQRAIFSTRKVVTSAVAVGGVVKDGSNDKECQPTTDGVGAIGIVTATPYGTGATGEKVQIAYLAGSAVIPVKVGTGGATRGKFAKVVSDGVTDATQTVTTPVATEIVGFFTQSGSAGDLVGLVPAKSWLTE